MDACVGCMCRDSLRGCAGRCPRRGFGRWFVPLGALERAWAVVILCAVVRGAARAENSDVGSLGRCVEERCSQEGMWGGGMSERGEKKQGFESHSKPCEWSGWRDLNPRPLRPERSALPSCATARKPRFMIHAITNIANRSVIDVARGDGLPESSESPDCTAIMMHGATERGAM